MHSAYPSHFISSITLTTSPLRKSLGNASAGENINILKNEAETEIEKVKRVCCVSDENVIMLGKT
jgi:hypothetical protein